jgi:uncharacterized membrane protein YcaP (DUF421 family)
MSISFGIKYLQRYQSLCKGLFTQYLFHMMISDITLFSLGNILLQASEGTFSLPDWGKMFLINTPLLEIFIRGTLSYLGIFLMLRFVLKREAGTLGVTDLLVVVLLADAIQNGMADDYKSITEGLLLVATIITWSHILSLLAFHFPRIQKIIQPPALILIKNGQMLKRNLRKELITENELMSQIREQGISSIDQIKEAFMETDGRISVITYDEKKAKNANKKTSL